VVNLVWLVVRLVGCKFNWLWVWLVMVVGFGICGWVGASARGAWSLEGGAGNSRTAPAP